MTLQILAVPPEKIRKNREKSAIDSFSFVVDDPVIRLTHLEQGDHQKRKTYLSH
jgi:hypothetical protein